MTTRFIRRVEGWRNSPVRTPNDLSPFLPECGLYLAANYQCGPTRLDNKYCQNAPTRAPAATPAIADPTRKLAFFASLLAGPVNRVSSRAKPNITTPPINAPMAG